MRNPGPGSRADERSVVEKLRALVSHHGTEETLRQVAREKLDILAPRRPSPARAGLRRRVSDRQVLPLAPVGEQVEADQGMTEGRHLPVDGWAAMAARAYAGPRPAAHSVDWLL